MLRTGAAFGAGTIQIVNASDSNGTNVITGNDINDTPLGGIIVNNDDNATSTAVISNNNIDGSGVGVNNGFGIQVRQDEDGDFTVLLHNNDIGDFDANQIRAQARDTTDGSGAMNVTVTDNTALNAPGSFIFGLEILQQDNNTVCADSWGGIDRLRSLVFPFERPVGCVDCVQVIVRAEVDNAVCADCWGGTDRFPSRVLIHKHAVVCNWDQFTSAMR